MRTVKTDQTWADAQADLSLCWAHSHIVGFVMRGSYHFTAAEKWNADSMPKLDKQL